MEIENTHATLKLPFLDPISHLDTIEFEYCFGVMDLSWSTNGPSIHIKVDMSITALPYRLSHSAHDLKVKSGEHINYS